MLKLNWMFVVPRYQVTYLHTRKIAEGRFDMEEVSTLQGAGNKQESPPYFADTHGHLPLHPHNRVFDSL